jgi:hypothetical protein
MVKRAAAKTVVTNYNPVTGEVSQSKGGAFTRILQSTSTSNGLIESESENARLMREFREAYYDYPEDPAVDEAVFFASRSVSQAKTIRHGILNGTTVQNAWEGRDILLNVTQRESGDGFNYDVVGSDVRVKLSNVEFEGKDSWSVYLPNGDRIVLPDEPAAIGMAQQQAGRLYSDYARLNDVDPNADYLSAIRATNRFEVAEALGEDAYPLYRELDRALRRAAIFSRNGTGEITKVDDLDVLTAEYVDPRAERLTVFVPGDSRCDVSIARKMEGILVNWEKNFGSDEVAAISYARLVAAKRYAKFAAKGDFE